MILALGEQFSRIRDVISISPRENRLNYKWKKKRLPKRNEDGEAEFEYTLR